ncbi:acyltransferase family protein [Parvularcula sp. LCG005]|uniref:acyltransferase family protein n=1 Tax=Parvularcula sp. LCG005 TaxID=3078805 RepID=UPI00294277C6|nr:acyltransferase family protein [Parvularcula sp. LCG005]WOI52419.1 acyltransferase family protein [Parvularcula sp. LCG005]
MKHRLDIDGLRSIAVLPVVLYHAGLGLPGGFVGVDVFFVISGFLITGIVARDIEEKRFTFANFMERRIRRLFPALFAVLALTTLMAAIVLIPSDFVDYAKSLIATCLYVSNIHFYMEIGYFTEAAHLKPLLHTWSLAVEEQFYLFLPVTMVVLYKFFPKAIRLGVLIVATVLSLLLSIWGTAEHASAAFYLLPTRAWELLLGGLLALGVFPRLGGRKKTAEMIGIVGLVGLLIANQFYSTAMPFPSYTALLPVLGTLFIIWSGTENQTLVARGLSWRPLVFIGNISYSLYLWHWPVIVFVRYGSNNDMSLGEKWFCVFLSVGLAYLSWRFVEQPFRYRKVLAKRTGLFIGGMIGSLATICLGFFIASQQGFDQRLEPRLRGLIASMEFEDVPNCHGLMEAQIAAGLACTRGADGVAPDFALIGDSHADAMASAVFDAARDLGRAGYQITGPGYLPLPEVYRIGAYDLRQMTDNTLAFLAAHEEVRTIILGGYWTHYVTGVTYRHEGSVYADAGYDGSGLYYNARAIENGLERLIAMFPDRQFILLEDPPSGRDLHILDYVRGEHTPWRKASVGLSEEEAVAQRASYEALLRKVGDRHDNVVVVDLLDAFCRDGLCPLFADDGSPLYRDGDHVNDVGASALKDRFEAALVEN